MMGTLTHRIQMICGDELSLLRRQMYALARQDIHEGAVDGAATAMARKPSPAMSGSGWSRAVAGKVPWAGSSITH
jgi:hypothetical protein